MPDSFVTEHLGQRHTDMLWRIGTTAGGWVYILILLEFQLGYQPRLRYLLIEIRAQDPASLPLDNVLAVIARFEQAPTAPGAGRAGRLAGGLA